jgi:hypothetical protein
MNDFTRFTVGDMCDSECITARIGARGEQIIAFT